MIIPETGTFISLKPPLFTASPEPIVEPVTSMIVYLKEDQPTGSLTTMLLLFFALIMSTEARLLLSICRYCSSYRTVIDFAPLEDVMTG